MAIKYSDIVDTDEMMIMDGIFKGLKIETVKEDGKEICKVSKIGKTGATLFSVKIDEPKVDEEILVGYFIDYLSHKCAEKIVNTAFNTFAKLEDKVFSERELPVSMKNTPPAFFLFYKDQLIESIKNDTEALATKREGLSGKYLDDKYFKDAKEEFETCVARTFNDFCNLCDEKVWPERNSGKDFGK